MGAEFQSGMAAAAVWILVDFAIRLLLSEVACFSDTVLRVEAGNGWRTGRVGEGRRMRTEKKIRSRVHREKCL